MTVQEYDAFTAGPCRICETTARKRGVDHDHATGEPRGALCTHCNTMIGMARDNPTYLALAAMYLEGLI